jgi:hypothetical protein
MILESAFFLHPNIASALVGQMARSITRIARTERTELDNGVKQTFHSDDATDSITGEIAGNGDDYDPWACENNDACPTVPFDYECVGSRCVPILPERVVDDATLRNAMATQYGCWIAIGGQQKWCKAIYPKEWPRETYPEWTSILGAGKEYEREVVNRSGKPNADIVRMSLNTIPESGTSSSNVLTTGNIKNMPWFGNVRLDTLPFTAERTEDGDDWSYWLGGPLVWTGFISNGLKVIYKFNWVTKSGVGAKPHQWLNWIPSSSPAKDKIGKLGIAGIQEDYSLSRNSNDYGWGEWITGSWHDECGGMWVGNSKQVVCDMIDSNCHFRMRYKATIVPDPMSPQFIDSSKGQISGALYGLNSAASSVQPHTLKIEVEGQNTTGSFRSSYAPASGDEYEVTIYRYGGNKQTLRMFADGTGKAIFSYPFPQEGLYQFTVDHVLSGEGCVVNQPNVDNPLFGVISPYFINFGVFVNPPPPKRGCTKVNDANYDPQAIISDDSCFDISGGGDDSSTGGGKGDSENLIQRFVDKNDTAVKGIALASAVFLGLVFFVSGGSNEGDA